MPHFTHYRQQDAMDCGPSVQVANIIPITRFSKVVEIPTN